MKNWFIRIGDIFMPVEDAISTVIGALGGLIYAFVLAGNVVIIFLIAILPRPLQPYGLLGIAWLLGLLFVKWTVDSYRNRYGCVAVALTLYTMFVLAAVVVFTWQVLTGKLYIDPSLHFP